MQGWCVGAYWNLVLLWKSQALWHSMDTPFRSLTPSVLSHSLALSLSRQSTLGSLSILVVLLCYVVSSQTRLTIDQTMPRENPLEIPEIALLVASHLKNKDLTSCLLVSKGWQGSFLPHRWRVIKAGSEEVFSRPWFGPCPLDIHRHRHLIYNLSLYGDPCGLRGFQFSNLRRLTLNCIFSAQDLEKSILLDLTEMFPLLVGLSLECVKTVATSWLTLSTHCHLRFLKLYRIEVKGVDVPKFWRACVNLESLELGRVSIGCKSIPADMVFDRMRKLWVWEITEPDEAAQLDLILRCPRLEDLYWSVGNEDDADPLPRLITHPIPSGHWPHLDRLTIECNLQDTDYIR